MIVLNEFVHRNDTVLVPLDLLINMVSLQLGKNLNDCLFEPCSYHQRPVVRGCEPLLPNSDSMDWLHSVTDLVILSCHELSSSGVFVDHVLKNEDISLLSKVDLVQHLYAGESSVEIIVEMLHSVVFLIIGKPVKFSYLKHRSESLLKRHLVRMVVLHQDDVQNIHNDKNINLNIADVITDHECCHNCQVNNKQD